MTAIKMVSFTVSMPATLRDRLDVAAMRNRNAGEGCGTRDGLIMGACEEWMENVDASPGEVRTVRRKRRSVRIDSACSHSKRGGGR